jgi:hypothetical protein
VPVLISDRSGARSFNAADPLIEVLDHVFVADEGRYFSYKERGFI